MSNPEVFKKFSVKPHTHNYWPCPNPIVKQSEYCIRFIPLFSHCELSHVNANLFFYLQFTNSQ